MYTGCPLPLAQTSIGGGLNAEREVICPSVNVSVPSGVVPSLFALHKVRFENRAISGVQDLYARGSVESKNDVDYYTVDTMTQYFAGKPVCVDMETEPGSPLRLTIYDQDGNQAGYVVSDENGNGKGLL